METFRLYLFSLAGAPPPPCGPAPAGLGPLPPPAAATAAPPPGPPPGPPAGRATAALPRLMFPKANARLMRRLTTNAPGALPKLRGMSVSPDSGVRLKFPKRVHLMFSAEQSAFIPAKLGRSLNCRSRFRSWPVVILNPGPVFDYERIHHHFPPWQIDGAEDRKPVPDIKRATSILARSIVRIHRKQRATLAIGVVTRFA